MKEIIEVQCRRRNLSKVYSFVRLLERVAKDENFKSCICIGRVQLAE